MKKLLIIANLVLLLLFLLKLRQLPPEIPIFYSRVWGEDQLADNLWIFILPLLMDIFFIINNYAYRRIFGENFFIKKIVDFLNLFIIIGFSLNFIRIILLVS